MTLAATGFSLLRPFLHKVDAEVAHDLTLKALRLMPVRQAKPADHRLEASYFGLQFPNPVGLAAGFDKNGAVIDQCLSLGFGFVEVGTTTPLPQDGNPKPRLFRLEEDQAVINRMGFNNRGHEIMHQALMNRARGGIVGVNIGANKDSPDRFSDYAIGVAQFAAIADYLTVNVSSPNTPGLRDLQSKQELNHLLTLIAETQAKISRRAPILLKIAPDLGWDGLADIAEVCLGKVDGVIISNTTTSREGLQSPLATEAGGLSGRPLFDLSTIQLARFSILTKRQIPLIGVGGICDAATAWMKIRAGASLLQLYSALVYSGPQLVTDIVAGISEHVSALGLKNYSEAIGIDAPSISEGQFFHQSGPGM